MTDMHAASDCTAAETPPAQSALAAGTAMDDPQGVHGSHALMIY